jgi:hypothetical protein
VAGFGLVQPAATSVFESVVGPYVAWSSVWTVSQIRARVVPWGARQVVSRAAIQRHTAAFGYQSAVSSGTGASWSANT